MHEKRISRVIPKKRNISHIKINSHKAQHSEKHKETNCDSHQ